MWFSNDSLCFIRFIIFHIVSSLYISGFQNCFSKFQNMSDMFTAGPHAVSELFSRFQNVLDMLIPVPHNVS